MPFTVDIQPRSATRDIQINVKFNSTIISRYTIPADDTDPEIKLGWLKIFKLLTGLASGTADAQMGGMFAQQYPSSGRFTIEISAGVAVGVINAASFLQADFRFGTTRKEQIISLLAIIFSIMASSTATLLSYELIKTFNINLPATIILNLFICPLTFAATVGDTYFGVQYVIKNIKEYMDRTPLYREHTLTLEKYGVNPAAIPLILLRVAMINGALLLCAISILGTGGEVVDFIGNITNLDASSSLALGNVLNVTEILPHIAWFMYFLGQIEHGLICLSQGIFMSKTMAARYGLCLLMSAAFGCAMYGICWKHYPKYAPWIDDTKELTYQQHFAILGAIAPACTVSIQAELIQTMEGVGKKIANGIKLLFPVARRLIASFSRILACRQAEPARAPLLPRPINGGAPPIN
jgi:hypothetical protein